MTEDNITNSRNVAKSRGVTSRLISLDALRGLAIVIMLLVNNFGAGERTPEPLKHAGWDPSIHLADMAFPWFLFCVGLAIPFSAAAAVRRGLTFRQTMVKALRRTALLFLLGAIVVSADDHRFTPISIGILQTIALSYLIATLIYRLSPRWRLSLAASLLIAYWAAIRFVPVPVWGAGAFQEDKNLILYLNQTYLDRFGLWNLTRIVPTTVFVLLGTFVSDLIRRSGPNPVRKVIQIAAVGVAFMLAGYLWSLDLPFNKPVWTPSYVLFCAGAGAMTLAFLHWVVDIVGWRSWTYPLLVFGSNAILAYVLPILVKSIVLIPNGFYIIGWVRVVSFILFWWIILWVLYRRRLFIRV